MEEGEADYGRVGAVEEGNGRGGHGGEAGGGQPADDGQSGHGGEVEGGHGGEVGYAAVSALRGKGATSEQGQVSPRDAATSACLDG